MRQVFSSARIENAEAVARMLEAEGIEVRIEHGRSFRNRIRGNFSYRAGATDGPRPTVWVVRSDDQPRARQLLRDAGLLHADSRPSSFLPDTTHAGVRAEHGRRKAARYRYGLVILAAIVAAAIWLKPRPDDAGTPAPAASVPAATLATATDAIHVLPVPHALAATLASRVHAGQEGALCLSLDGGDAPPPVLDALRADGIDAHAATSEACGGEVPHLEIRDWRTDGSGSGEVSWSVTRGGEPPMVRTAQASRKDDVWRVDIAP